MLREKAATAGRPGRISLFCGLAAVCLAALLLTGRPALAQDARPVLVFSFNQGFANGPVENGDTAALQHMFDSLKTFSSRYRVYVLFNIWHSRLAQYDGALELARQNGFPFLLDVYSSDAITIPPADGGLADVSHGVPLSLDDLAQVRRKYGRSFAGIRSFEVFGEDFTVLACRNQGRPWCKPFEDKLPSDRFFDPSRLEAFVRFADRNDMTVLFSESRWSFDRSRDTAQEKSDQLEREQALSRIMRKYPNRITVVYANNEAKGASERVFGRWQQGLAPFLADGASGIGLSDQAWICPPPVLSCPVATLTRWAQDALASHVSVLQTEPYWYWWDLPAGRKFDNYGQYKTVEARGRPRGHLACLAQALNVPPTGMPACSDQTDGDSGRAK